MIRGFGRETFSTYCQTLNWCELINECKHIGKSEYVFLFVDIFW